MKPLFLLSLLLLASVAADAAGIALHLAPNGNDTWSGRSAALNRHGTDGPLATPQGALARIRALRAAGQATGPVTVQVERGTYALSAPLVVTPADSDVTFAGDKRQRPVFSGGRPITGWHADSQGFWEAAVPDAQSAPFNELFVNGARRNRPVLPVTGFYTIADHAPPTVAGQPDDRFQFSPGDIRAEWHNPGDINVLCYLIWSMARLRIASVDEASHIVTFTGHVAATDYWSALAKGNRYRVENVFEALPQEPGTWYLDRTAGVVYYHPLPGETLDHFEAIAPRLTTLVQMQGDPDAKQWVQNVYFRGISFQHTDWTLPPQGRSFPQSEVDLGGVITAVGARDCVLADCEISHIGTFGVEWGRACQNDVLDHCVLHDLGAGGVKIGEMQIRTNPGDVTENNTVQDCQIFDGGVVHQAACGLWIGQSPGNRILHNDIHDLYQIGVSIGWTWGFGDALAQNNLVAYNHIYNIGRGLLSDMGGIYILGNQTGTVLTHNLIHDVNAATYGGWGIYFDEGTTNIVATDNIVYNTKTGGFHQHYGRNNLVQNNVFAFATTAQLQHTRNEDHLAFTFDHNIIVWNQGDLLNGNWEGSQVALDYNDYWDYSGRPVTFGGKSFADWQKEGHDLHSIIADPLFVDAPKFDFRLRPHSPALALGFHPIDVSEVGPRRK